MSLTTDTPLEPAGDAAEMRPAVTSRLDKLPWAAMWVAVGRGLGIGSTILATFIVPRLLTPRDFGELTALLSVISFAAIVAQLGLGHSTVRFLAESLTLHDPQRAARTLQLGFRILAVASMITCLAISSFLWIFGQTLFHLSSLASLVPLTAALILLLAWQQFSAESLRGLHELRWASLFSGGTFGGPAPVLLFLGFLGIAALQGSPSLTTTLICQIAGSGISFVATILCLRYTVQVVCPSSEIAQASGRQLALRELLHVCLPMAAFQFFVIVTQCADVWLATYYCPPEQVALYGIARRFAVLLNVPMQLAVNTVISSIPHYHTQGELGELQTMLRRAATLASLPTLALGLACILGGKWLLGIGSGEYYAQAAPTLAILSIGPIAMALFGSGGMTLALTGRQSVSMLICLGSATFLCVAGPLAAQRWGINGIAAVAAATFALQSAVEWLACRRIVGIWTHLDLRPASLHWLVKIFSRRSQ